MHISCFDSCVVFPCFSCLFSLIWRTENTSCFLVWVQRFCCFPLTFAISSLPSYFCHDWSKFWQLQREEKVVFLFIPMKMSWSVKNCQMFFSFSATVCSPYFQLNSIFLKLQNLREFGSIQWRWHWPVVLAPQDNKLSGILNAWNYICNQKLPAVSLLKLKWNKGMW